MIVHMVEGLTDTAIGYVEKYHNGRAFLIDILKLHEADIYGPRFVDDKERVQLFVQVVKQYHEWGIKIPLRNSDRHKNI